jgi:hypothetical protein
VRTQIRAHNKTQGSGCQASQCLTFCSYVQMLECFSTGPKVRWTTIFPMVPFPCCAMGLGELLADPKRNPDGAAYGCHGDGRMCGAVRNQLTRPPAARALCSTSGTSGPAMSSDNTFETSSASSNFTSASAGDRPFRQSLGILQRIRRLEKQMKQTRKASENNEVALAQVVATLTTISATCAEVSRTQKEISDTQKEIGKHLSGTSMLANRASTVPAVPASGGPSRAPSAETHLPPPVSPVGPTWTAEKYPADEHAVVVCEQLASGLGFPNLKLSRETQDRVRKFLRYDWQARPGRAGYIRKNRHRWAISKSGWEAFLIDVAETFDVVCANGCVEVNVK